MGGGHRHAGLMPAPDRRAGADHPALVVAAIRARTQLAAYQTQIASSRRMHENVRVVFETDVGRGLRTAAGRGLREGEVPNIVTHLPSFAVSNYWRNGLLEPFNDVIDDRPGQVL